MLPLALLLFSAAGLHEAVQRDDVATVQSLIEAGADVKAPSRYGVPPLLPACTNGNARVVELLLTAGADPNSSGPGGETALMTCSRAGSLESVKLLLARGADVHGKEQRRGQTALMWAAAEGHASVIKTLLEAGAHVRSRLDSGYTPFLLAVREGRLDAVKVLVEAGADVNDTIRPSERPGPRPASGAGAPRPGTSAIHLATVNAHFDLAAYLLDKGANPNAAEVGYTPLHIITWVRKPGGGDNDPAPRGSGLMTSLDFVRKLVKHGADVNARMARKQNVGLTSLNTVGATPFLLAARTADAELMRLLAELGADARIPNADGATPLIVAAGLGTRSPGEDAGTEEEVVEAVQVCLELGNDINAVDNNGETAMHGAAYKNLPAVVELLANKGARIDVWNRRNKQGWTPMTIAQGYRFGNYKPSHVTVEALRKVMLMAGVEPDQNWRPLNAGKNSEYAK